MATTPCPWDAFGCIRCINLKSRPDRKERVLSSFRGVGLADRVRFYHPERSPHGGIFGACESHFIVIKEAYESGEPTLVVFEDDVIFHKGWEAVLTDATVFMQTNDTWEQFFLGCGIFHVNGATAAPRVYNVDAVFCHAYVLSRRGMRRFVEGWGGEVSHNGWPHPKLVIDGVDTWWCTRSAEQYATRATNLLINQEWDLMSDNQWPQCDAHRADLRAWIQNEWMVGCMEALCPLVWATASLPDALRPVLHNWSYRNSRGQPRRPPLLWLLVGLPLLGWLVALRSPPSGLGFGPLLLPILAWEAIKHLLCSVKWWWNLDGIAWSKQAAPGSTRTAVDS